MGPWAVGTGVGWDHTNLDPVSDAGIGGRGVGPIPLPDTVSDILIHSNQYLLSHIFWCIGVGIMGIGGGWGP